jgi:hypothetical protein
MYVARVSRYREFRESPRAYTLLYRRRSAVVSGHAAEREAAVKEVATHGWYVARETTRGYYIMRCSCGRHQTTVHKTPSLPNHFQQKVAWMIRQCSTQQGGKDSC